MFFDCSFCNFNIQLWNAFSSCFNQTAVSKAGRAAHLLPRLHPRSCEPPPHRNARVQHFSRISQKRLGNYLPDGESWFMVIHRVFYDTSLDIRISDSLPVSLNVSQKLSCLSLIHLITIMATTENLLYIEIKKKKNTVELNELHWTKVGKKLQSYKRAVLKEELMK